MRKDSGSVLAIVLIIMTALYLLAGVMLVINRQYFSDVEMLQDSVISRQKLLSISHEFLGDMDEMLKEEGLSERSDCDVRSQPKYLWNDDKEIFYQVARLSRFCSGGVNTIRLWLKDTDNYENTIVIDYLLEIDGWIDAIDFEKIFGVISINNKSWMLSLDNKIFNREFVLIEEGIDYGLIEQKTRIIDDHLELVLIFENNVAGLVRLYHLWVPIGELHFDKEMLFQYFSEKHIAEDKVELIALNKNDERKRNWWVEFSDSLFEKIVIKNEVIFLAMQNSNNQKSIAGLYISGLLFFSDVDIGYIENSEVKQKELIPCVDGEKFIVAEKWHIGCDNNKRVRYYFME